MIWKILRPHFWMLDRRLRQTNRLLVVGLIAALAFLLQWIWSNFLRDKLALLPPEQTAMFIAEFMPLTLYIMLSFALLGVGDVMRQLYLASDLDLLMMAPIPQRTIFVVKLLQCSRATYIPALMLGAFFFALGLVQNAALSFFLLVGVLLVAGMILTTTVVMLLVMLLARVLPARFVRAWMPVAISIVVFALMFGQQSLNQWLHTQTGLIKFLTEASFNPGQLALVVLGVGGVALLTGLVAYRIFDRTFQGGWDHLKEVPAQRKSASSGAARRRGVSRLVRPLPEPLRSLLAKEWLELRRDPQGLLNLVMVALLILMFMLSLLMLGGSAFATLQPLFFWFMLVFIGMLLTIMTIGMTMMSVAREGRNISLLRSAPISMEDMLKGKYWAGWTPMSLMWLVVILVAGILLKLPAWQIGALEAVTILGLSGTLLAALAIGGLKVDFEAMDLKHRIPVLASYLTMALNGVFMLLTICGMVWIIVRLFPDNPIVFVIQALSGFAPIGWIFLDNLWIPIALLGSQAMFWAGMRLLWVAAVRRLEAWEGI